MTETPNPKLKRLQINEVQIFVIDLAKARDFYSRILGLPIRTEDASSIHLDAGVLEIVLMAGAREKKQKKGFGTISDVSLCFDVENIKEWHKRLSTRGVFFFSEINELPSRKYCAFMDPEGNLLELVERTSF